MDLKTLAKANVLQEKIDYTNKVLNAINAQNSKFDIWVKSDEGDEFSIHDMIPIDIKIGILQAAKSALETELKRMDTEFSAL